MTVSRTVSAVSGTVSVTVSGVSVPASVDRQRDRQSGPSASPSVGVSVTVVSDGHSGMPAISPGWLPTAGERVQGSPAGTAPAGGVTRRPGFPVPGRRPDHRPRGAADERCKPAAASRPGEGGAGRRAAGPGRDAEGTGGPAAGTERLGPRQDTAVSRADPDPWPAAAKGSRTRPAQRRETAAESAGPGGPLLARGRNSGACPSSGEHPLARASIRTRGGTL